MSTHVALKTVWILISWLLKLIWIYTVYKRVDICNAWFHTVLESVNCLSTERYKLICTIRQVKFSLDKYIMAIYLSMDQYYFHTLRFCITFGGVEIVIFSTCPGTTIIAVMYLSKENFTSERTD